MNKGRSNLIKEQCKKIFTVVNDKGLHTRPATELVKCISRYKSEVTLTLHDVTVNAKSLLGILMLAAAKGSKIEVEAVGVDAVEAVDALVELAKNKFYINY